MRMPDILINEFVRTSELPIISIVGVLKPWEAISDLDAIIVQLIGNLDCSEYLIRDGQAIHRSAKIEESAQLKGPMVIGPDCFVANGTLL